MSPLLLYFGILNVFLVKEVFSELMCFQCNTQNEPNCWNIKKTDRFNEYYLPCPGKNANYVEEYKKPLCRTIEQTIKVRDNLRVIHRSCGYELYNNVIEGNVCYDVRNNDHDERVCQCFEDGCNNSNTIFINVNLFLICCLTIFLFYR